MRLYDEDERTSSIQPHPSIGRGATRNEARLLTAWFCKSNFPVHLIIALIHFNSIFMTIGQNVRYGHFTCSKIDAILDPIHYAIYAMGLFHDSTY